MRRPPSSFSSEVFRLQRALFRANERLINEAVDGYTPEFRRYRARYANSVKRFIGSTTQRRLVAASKRYDVVLVGDYHTFQPAQRAFVRLLRQQPRRRPVVIGLEMFRAEHQDAIDAYVEGRIKERTFLKRTQFCRDWPFSPFSTLRPIFDLARERKWRIVPLEGRGRRRRSLAERDRAAARAIVRALKDDDGARVFVLIGDMHLAPKHLPRQIEVVAKRSGVTPSVLRIHQNPETVWFEHLERERSPTSGVVVLGDDAFAMLSASPIVCQQSFLTWLDRLDEEEPEAPFPTARGQERIVRQSLRAIGRALDIPVRGALSGVEVHGPDDLSFLDRLKARKTFHRTELSQIRSHILSGESCYLPKARIVYLSGTSFSAAAEEAAHLLRHIKSGEEVGEGLDVIEAFYFRVMNEAVGFLGSKIVNPKRRCFHERDLRLIALEGPKNGYRPLAQQAAKLALAHREMELGKRSDGIAGALGASPELFHATTHLLGYALGDRIYSALCAGKLSRSKARALFEEPFAGKHAILRYFELSSTLKSPF